MTDNDRRHLHVACAIIEHDGLVLAARRSSLMSLPLKWEFPGGKVEPGESLEACLQRELFEELGVQVSPVRNLISHTHHYPDFTITLYPFVCSIAGGTIRIHEHEAIVWLPPEKLCELDWAEADLPVIAGYLQAVG